MFNTKNRGPALPVVDAGPYTQLFKRAQTWYLVNIVFMTCAFLYILAPCV